MKFIIITNNPMVRDELSNECCVQYHATSLNELLLLVRDRVHAGHKLLTHPLSGSVKPNETPFKSVMISSQMGKLDYESVRIIEESVTMAKKFPIKFPQLSEKLRSDFELIDFGLIQSAVRSANQ
ncbi:MAG: hypothetical protein ABT01_08955 [Clostridium sp. SCN 57-10]|nr:MAG: hypothetical protein ABT01_08955 [Clostridium sp. SCN 57-10]